MSDVDAMTVPSADDFDAVDQMIGYQLGEDWPYEYDGIYEAVEDWVGFMQDETLSRFVREVDRLFDVVPDGATRLTMFSTGYAFGPLEAERFDTYLRAVRDRAAEAVAGIHNHPLMDPPS